MCGILIVINKNKKKLKIKKNILNHRGPDFSKYLYRNNINFRHWRLSIVDLTKNSNQPMEDKNNIFLYNGEIYDYKNLSKEILKEKSKSDTIFLFKLLKKKKFDLINNFSGFYAYAYLNKKENKLYFGRDVIGKKPLYYYNNENYFILSSEEKGIYKFLKQKEINNKAITEYFFFKSLSYGKTFYKNIYLIPPGSNFNFSINDWKLNTDKNWEQYYQKPLFTNNKQNNFIKEFSSLIKESIEKRNNCDVQTQLALSSGQDSNLILNQIVNNHNIKNFKQSIGVGFDKKNNENFYSKIICKENNTKFIDLRFKEKDTLRLMKKCIESNDGPLDHPNYMAFDVLCKKASNYGKVLLTGEGADDLFFGYNHYKKNSRKECFAFRIFYDKKILNDILKNKINNSEFKIILNNINFHQKKKDIKKSIFYSRELEFKTHLQSLLKRNDRISMKNSIEVRCPFLDLNIIKKIPSNLKIIKKKLFINLLPYVYLKNIDKKKIGFYTPINKYLQNNRQKEINFFIEKAGKFLEKENNILINSNLKKTPKIRWTLLNIGIFIHQNEK
jgi:asparagine synthase (glutamine-hydrolysing)